ncbi:hypothetical protein RvY_15262-2 [Ramazzottius varieornatus]|uniref:Ubiquinone biosynthesis protein n=1 Tax=Ramazzottius varieornatus TaxID=947166 RepID=A0A1D1VUB5_RAMVA|nr:hypothetical protein RvY_15262-2 [Ramazzottius varieornatus]
MISLRAVQTAVKHRPAISTVSSPRSSRCPHGRAPTRFAQYSTTPFKLSTSRFHLEDSLNEKFKERMTVSHSASTTSTSDGDAEASPARSSDSSTSTFASSTSDDFQEEPSSSNSGKQLKERILNAGLSYVPEYGWTIEALAKGAEKSGLPSIAHGLCPNGGLDLVIYAYDQSNRQFEATFQPFERQKAEPGISFKEYLVSAIRARLELNTAYGSDWKDAIALLSLPQNTRQGLRLVGQLADDIWHLLGDNKIDSNWYAKRIAIIALYQSTELYLLQDRSEGYQDTWDFLERRAEDFVRLHNKAAKVQQPLLNIVPFLQAASATMSNMLGWNQRRTF